MAFKINRTIVEEDIVDKEGKVLGKLRFDPKDSKIMNKMSDILKYITTEFKEAKNLKNIESIDIENLDSAEEFEKASESFENIHKAISIEHDSIKYVIDNLTDIFGEETMNIITGGSISLENVLPLIEFITPYVAEYRKELLGKYTNEKRTDIL